MKLITFSVKNYRSITTAHKISMKNYTVLVGKNNEGKSNILKALKLSMEVLIRHSHRNIGSGLKIYCDYNWDRDFPMQYQNRKSGLQSIFRLQFELNEAELIQFSTEIGSKLNGNIDIEIKIGKGNNVEITVPKKGKGALVLTNKSNKIAQFISRRIAFNYIPTIRTENQVINIIRETLADELSIIEQNSNYIEAIETINRLQQEVLDSIAFKIKGPLQEFMPTINNIKIEILEERRRMDLRKSVEVIVDDGIPTSIEYKGDGVKSLAALAMLKNKNYLKSAPVIAIEEPESHLHPSAIHQLKEIILGLSETNQVIITTHNPLFVATDNIKSNIIVDGGKAGQAKNIKEIRDVLGIKASDNLINSSYVLVVEGEDDKISLNKLLANANEKIGKALKANILKIEEIGGAGNLPYKLSSLRNTLCTYHVLLDNDEAGKKAYNAAQKDGLVSIKNATFTNCNGMNESEFEDCLDSNAYKNLINEKFGVRLDVAEFRNNRKWSDRMKVTFKSQGKNWSEAIEKEVKVIVAQGISGNHEISLNEHKRTSIDALIRSLEEMIKL
jgi:hypothetical protein